MTVSVIVPIYNVEAYLARCVDSVLHQSFPDFELILVDDGSPDRCGAICDEYAGKDHRVRVIHQENGGISSARNAGMERACGEWIAFVDPDDWLHRDYLKTLTAGIRDDTDLVVCGYQTTDRPTETDAVLKDIVFTNDIDGGAVSRHFIETNVWGRLYKRESVSARRFVPGTEPVEDKVFNDFFLSSDKHISVTSAKLYYYFMRDGSAVHRDFGRRILNAVHPILSCVPTAESAGLRVRLIRRAYKCALSARYDVGLQGMDEGERKQARRLFRELAPFRRELPVRERAVYGLFAACPGIYRLYRIADDPTLRQYERNKKNA